MISLVRRMWGLDRPLGAGVVGLRERILRSILRVAIVFGLVAYVPSMVLSVAVRFWHVAIADTLVYGAILVTAAAHGWSFRVRAASLLGIMYALSVFLLVTVGPAGAGPLWLMAFSLVATLLGGMRAAVTTLVVNALTLAGVTAFDAFRPDSLAAPWAPIPAMLWLMEGGNLLALDAAVALSLAVLLDGLEAEVTRRHSLEGFLSRLAAAVEQAAELVVITDLDGHVEYANTAFARQTGLDVAVVLGHRLEELGVLGGKAAAADEIWSTVRGGTPWSGTVRNRRRDGSTYEAEVGLSPVRDDSGAVAHVVGVIRDVTRESELRHHLQRSQKLEAVGTLAAGIAHDFNNILVPIIANADLVRDGLPPGSPAREDLTDVLNAAERAALLVRRILTFSRQMRAEREAVVVAPLVNETTKLLRASLPTTIEMRMELESGDAAVLAEPAEVQQIVVNLCTNAAHAMRERGGVLRVRLARVSEGALPIPRPLGLGEAPSYVHLAVYDTGTGIAPGDLDRIFDPFFTTKDPGEGTGLGLAMVHAIVGSLGGAVTVDSSPGVGTQFDVYLPTLASARTSAEPPPPPEPQGAGLRALVVDDEPAIVEVCARLLGLWGFDVLATSSAQHALELLSGVKPAPALLLTDLTMPQLTGLELAEAARALAPGIAVIVMSGLLERESATRIDAARVDGILPKPFSPGRLAGAVAAALGQHRSEPELVAGAGGS